jgi:hypothetical protein
MQETPWASLSPEEELAVSHRLRKEEKEFCNVRLAQTKKHYTKTLLYKSMEHRMYRAVQNGNSQRYVPRDYNNRPHQEQEATKRKFRIQFWRVSKILQFGFTACLLEPFKATNNLCLTQLIFPQFGMHRNGGVKQWQSSQPSNH